MGGAKGIVDVDIRQLGEGMRHLGVVRLLFREEADVFQQDHLARLEGLRRFYRFGADDVVEGVDGRSQQLAQALADAGVRHAQRFDDLAVGAAEVRAEDDPRPFLPQVLDRRQGGAQAAVVEDAAGLLVERDVEVLADEHALALHVDVADCHLVHGSLPSRQE